MRRFTAREAARRLLRAPKDEQRAAAFRKVIRQIPRGKVATYGQVAAAAGYPLYHRQVAQLLRGSPIGSLPWQRVVGAGVEGGQRRKDGAAQSERVARARGDRGAQAGVQCGARRCVDLRRAPVGDEGHLTQIGGPFGIGGLARPRRQQAAQIRHRFRRMEEVPARSPESDAMSKDLARRGFRFVGSTICYAFMQATGMVNDHLVTCFRHRELAK